jgi:hypothetical protein
MLAISRNRRESIFSLRNNGYIRQVLQHRHDARPEDGVVVHHQQANLFGFQSKSSN